MVASDESVGYGRMFNGATEEDKSNWVWSFYSEKIKEGLLNVELTAVYVGFSFGGDGSQRLGEGNEVFGTGNDGGAFGMVWLF
ncbi:hypothetical protein D5086_019129 [Populus alba]|uniref:Uncharacterized protein n=1 Tax=Populus alba TaxID=43335 RepID=A0ACC4BGB0_POPAL